MTASKGFHILHNRREGRRWDDVSVVSKSSCTLNKTSSIRTFEVLDVNLLLLPDVQLFVAIYRPPYNPPSLKWTISEIFGGIYVLFG